MSDSFKRMTFYFYLIVSSAAAGMPRKTLPHKTSGTGMLCGIYALAGAFADSKFPDVNDRDERKLQA